MVDTTAQNTELIEAWIARHQNVLSIFLDAYCIVNEQGKVIEFNVAFTELCGESYRRIKKTDSLCDLIKTEFCPAKCPATQIIQSKSALRLDEVMASSKAFASLQLIISGIPIFGANNALLGALMTIRDVSAESELQKKYSERKFESITDGLTQIYNKAYSEAALVKLLKGSLRDKPGISVVLSDIDHFKKVNDTYGHQAGDHVLTLVAQTFKGLVRDTDIVGRFGGEEFIGVLPNCDTEGSRLFAERFRSAVANTKIVFEGKHIPVTISIGTASFQRKWEEGLDIDECVANLVGQADTALYFAKNHGRNQACQFESLPSEDETAESASSKAGVINKKAA